MMTELAAWLLETTIVVTALLGAVLLLRHPLAQAANVRWAYLLWAVPVLVLLLRLLPERLRAVPASLVDVAGLGGFTPAVDSAWLPGWTAMALLTLWGLGFLVSASRLAIDHVRTRRAYLANARALPAGDRRVLARFCDRMQIFPAVGCLETPALDAPALIGFFRPTLLLPPGFLRTCTEPELVIRHELVHFRRRDPVFNALASLLRCALWFNPLATAAERRFRDDQEVACDRAVVADVGAEQRYGYGRALVRSVLPEPGPLTGFMATETALKRRLRWLALHRVDFRREATGALAVAALAVAGVAFGVEAPATALDWTTSLTFPEPLPGGCGG